MYTRTGNFLIGFRRGWSDWQKNLDALAVWTKGAGFAALDVGPATREDIAILRKQGLRIGSADLMQFDQIMNDDPGKRKEVIEGNIAYVSQAAEWGVKAFFTCIMPGDPTRKREENYRLAVESFAPIADACAAVGTSLAIEGWPGHAPHLANLCCNPETTRAFLKDVGPGAGLNYDPSHLIRLRIDHVRFLREFAAHVKHVHAKDTQVMEDALYEIGTQPSAFTRAHDFGEWVWRYTIPGHGVARWGEIFAILKQSGFAGIVSIELEDESFLGSEEGEKTALSLSLAFLDGV